MHGGAIDLAYDAFRQIRTSEKVPIFIEGVKKKKARLFGYGHRVYKTRDPRAALIEELMKEHRETVDANPLLRVAMAIDRTANEDPYFVERGLKANTDLLGCFLYTAMYVKPSSTEVFGLLGTLAKTHFSYLRGFETDMVIALTAISRAVGGKAHWRESLGMFSIFSLYQVFIDYLK